MHKAFPSLPAVKLQMPVLHYNNQILDCNLILMYCMHHNIGNSSEMNADIIIMLLTPFRAWTVSLKFAKLRKYMNKLKKINVTDFQ